MSRVLRVDERFSSEQIGATLARLWTVNGLALELVDITEACGGLCESDLCICTFTTERPTKFVDGPQVIVTVLGVEISCELDGKCLCATLQTCCQ